MFLGWLNRPSKGNRFLTQIRAAGDASKALSAVFYCPRDIVRFEPVIDSKRFHDNWLSDSLLSKRLVTKSPLSSVHTTKSRLLSGLPLNWCLLGLGILFLGDFQMPG